MDPQLTATNETETKCVKLRAYFPPDRIGWETDPKELDSAKPGEAVTCVPFAAQTAIKDRLDEVLGMDNWQEAYDNPADYTRCVLRVRFTPGGDWVSRVGLSNAKALDKAHAEALRRAALSLGIGRYLENCPQAVELAENKRYKSWPRVPEEFLPLAYRKCGRERGHTIRQLLNTACDESAKRGRKLDPNSAANDLAARHGYKPAPGTESVNLTLLQNRHAEALTKTVNEWIAELARGQTTGPAAPKIPDKTPENKSENSSAPTAAAKPNENKPASGTGEKTPPQNTPAH